MRFSLVLPGHEIPENIKDALNEQPARSGMYNWIFAFKGEVNTWDYVKEHINDYDVLQVNMSPADMPLIPEIRRKIDQTPGCKTKLVINNDYVCEFWDKWGIDPWRYKQIQRMGDMVFGTEEHQTSNMINGAFTIPHPTNTKVLKSLGYDKDEAEDSVGFIYHWWAPQTYLAHMTLEDVKKKYDIKKSRVFGYTSTMDPMAKYRGYMFDKVTPLIEFPRFADLIQKQKCLFDPNPCHTYGRNGVEAACLRVPIVGSNRVFSQKLLFPELACDPYDKKEIMRLFEIVFNNPEKLKEIQDKAYEKVEYFNYENSVKRYLEALEIAVNRGGNKWYQTQD